MGIRQVSGKVAELYVFNELLKRGAAVYVPLVDEGLDAIVRTAGGHTIDLQIKSAGTAGGKYPRWFQVAKVAPRPDFFIISVEAKDRELGDVWVFPSIVFDAYASKPPKGSPRDLDLDAGVRKYGLPLRELLCGFRNRWELIINFDRYRDLLKSPENLEDILAMTESLDAPEEEAMDLEQYEHRRSTTLPG